jgi:hypothetical protein
MEEVYEFLKKCGTYYIATMDGDQPRVRPFGTVLSFGNKLYNGFAWRPLLLRMTGLKQERRCWMHTPN